MLGKPSMRDTPYKEKRVVWENYNMDSVRLGISMEKIELEVEGEEGCDVDLRDLIDPLILILGHSGRESSLDVFKNAHNSLLGDFRSIKLIYHEVIDMKEGMNNLEDKANQQKTIVERQHIIEKKTQRLETTQQKLIQ